MTILEDLQEASRALDCNDLELAAQLIDRVEANISSVPDRKLAAQIRANLGGVAIDLGSWTNDEELIERGIRYVTALFSSLPEEEHLVQHYYNAANGFSALWQMHSADVFATGSLGKSLEKAKDCYRKALDLTRTRSGFILENPDLYNQLLVNYGNCFDSVGRSIEAITQYDRALKRDRLMGQALGNKGITLVWIAPLAHGHQHLFYLEAQRLLSEALKRPLHPRAHETFQKYFEYVSNIIGLHKNMEPKKIDDTRPASQFHKFLRVFCLENDLYLTPTTLVGATDIIVLGDPMFISYMVAPIRDDRKFDRYVTYLNQIKQDYVLARYLLVQSQYRSDSVDAIDEGVLLFYPLDYSLHSAYIQMLKTAFRLAVDVLDKIAHFIRDYYQVHSLGVKNIYFRTVFSNKNSSLALRPELRKINNPFLFALFDLALDLNQGGCYEYIYDRRNTLTHRVLVVHDMIVRDNETEAGIERVCVKDFLRETITVMQIVRAAVMYLILMVDSEEKKVQGEGGFGVIPGTPVDGVFRWVPPLGDQ